MLTLTVNNSALTRSFANLEKQLHFAATVALTRTAQDAQEEVKRQLPRRFTIRTGWLAKGIRIRPANRNRLVSAVLDLDDFMALQETGGEKRSPFGDALGIPFGARPTPRSVTRPSKYPGALMAKAGYFIAPLSTLMGGSARVGVWQRYGKPMVMVKGRYLGRKRQPIRLMYALADHVTLQPRFEFSRTVAGVAHRQFKKRFDEALRQALASAR